MAWLLEHGRIPFLVIVALITSFAGYQCLGLRVDLENLSMESDDPDLASAEGDFDRLFGEAEMVLVVVHRRGLLEDAGRRLLGDLVDALRGIEGITGVDSLVDSDFAILPFHEGLSISADRNRNPPA